MEGPTGATDFSIEEALLSMKSEEEPEECIPPLNKENYKTWKEKMERTLKKKGLWGCFDGTILELYEPSSKEYLIKRAEARSLLRTSCGPWNEPYIEGLEPNSIWKQLVIMYESTHPTNTGVMMKWTNYTWCVPFYNAIAYGNWKTVHQFLSRNGEALTARLTSEGEYPLHVAVQKGKVELVKELVKMIHKDDLSVQGKFSRTALHIAASDGNIEIVKALVEKDPTLVMIESDYYDYSIPITVAARAGNKDVVRHLYPITIEKQRNQGEDNSGTRATVLSPEKQRATLLTSLIFGDLHDLALDLLQSYPELVLVKDANGITCIGALSRKPSAFQSSFPTKENGLGTFGYYSHIFMYPLLDVQVDAEDACRHKGGDLENSFDTNGNGNQDSIIFHRGKCLSLCFRRLFQKALKLVPGRNYIYDEKLKHYRASELLKEAWRLVSEIDDLGDVEDIVVAVMFRAIEVGIVEFVEEIINQCPQLLMQTYRSSNERKDQETHVGQTIFHYAIRYRHEKIFRLIYRLGPIKNDLARIADSSKNLMSHLAAKQAHIQRLSQVAGSALQVQRELQWYQEVDHIMPLMYKDFKNSDEKTPKMLFTEEHKELVKDGATWMKDTSTQCMVVATLITTIMFASVFTIPGFEFSDTEKPNYVQGKFRIVFVVSNILALCSSVASMLIFLAIITSRYAEEDFLKHLPQMLMMGLFSLFFSIVGMMTAFVAAILFMLHYKVLWISIPIVLLASIPITIYALVELPLFIELMNSSTTRAKFFRKIKQA